MIQPEPNFCRNCINFVERRDIEGFAACVRNHRPRIACQDFRDSFLSLRKESSLKRVRVYRVISTI